MNRLLAATVALASIAFAGAALADDITIDTPHPVSTKSRAEVRAEFLAERQQAAALTREDSGSQSITTTGQQRTPVAAGRTASRVQ